MLDKDTYVQASQPASQPASQGANHSTMESAKTWEQYHTNSHLVFNQFMQSEITAWLEP